MLLFLFVRDGTNKDKSSVCVQRKNGFVAAKVEKPGRPKFRAKQALCRIANNFQGVREVQEHCFRIISLLKTWKYCTFEATRMDNSFGQRTPPEASAPLTRMEDLNRIKMRYNRHKDYISRIPETG